MPKRKRKVSSDDFYKRKHKRLDTIALIAKILAWLVLLVSFLAAIGEFIQTKNFLEFEIMNGVLGGTADFSDLMSQRPIFSISLFVEMFNTILNGVIYAVVLKAISLALYMLIEIDLNYSLMNEGE